MNDRITKRLPNGGVMYDNGEYFHVCYPWNEHCLNNIDRIAIKLCDFEDKIEQGELVEVVRCKDCTEWDEKEQECSHWYGFRENDYCSYGERSEG